jgi:hypothetical protein
MNRDATVALAPQHLRALERANRVRLARAALKRRVASGEMTVLEVILSCPWEADSMPLSDLLMSQRRWGRTRCRKLLASLSLAENKPVGSLTTRQRAALVARLRAAGAGHAAHSVAATAEPLVWRSRPAALQSARSDLASVGAP